MPEGSYSTDPEHGEVRIREFKEMIQALHRNGFRVIMDVVYNHMYSLDNNLNRTVPWYYFRTDKNGEDFQWLCLWKRCGKRASYVRQIYSGFGALLGKGISY